MLPILNRGLLDNNAEEQNDTQQQRRVQSLALLGP